MKFRSFYRTFFFKLVTQSVKHLKAMAQLGVIFCICNIQSANAQAAIEDIAQLRIKIAQFLTDEYRNSQADKVDVKVGRLDMRLRLALCDQPIAFSLQDPTGNGGNINVQVACRGSSRWTILAPAQATVFRPMAVAGRNLQRGEIVNIADVTIESLDMGPYRQGYNVNIDDIVGKEVKYPINKGEPFRTSVLNAPLAIKRGDEVVMEASIGSIRVSSNGTAISDGRIGQQIRVKNNQSARIINARVVGPGKVESIL